MSLSAEEKKHLCDVLDNTGANRKALKSDRVIPDEYKAYQNQVERTEVVVPVPAVNVPVKCYISTAKDKSENCPVHINMHGGGFVFPQDTDDDMYCAHVASKIHGIVVDIDYATAFEHPFPVAFEQSYAVVKWVFEQCRKWGVDSKRVSVGGHSAGGCLAAAISLRAAGSKDFKLCLQVLDFAATNNYKAVLEGGDERSSVFSKFYSDGDNRVLQSPYVSPVFATDKMLLGQPRTLIVNGGKCPFKDDNQKYGMRLAAMGTEVTIKTFVNSRHGFTIRMKDEWQQAQELIIRTINEAYL